MSYNGGGGGIIHVSLVRRCFSLIIEIYLALQKTEKDSCHCQLVWLSYMLKRGFKLDSEL